MLNNLNEASREWYEQAERCALQADIQTDPKVKQQFLELKRLWLILAHSYELTESQTRFSNETKQRACRGMPKRRFPPPWSVERDLPGCALSHRFFLTPDYCVTYLNSCLQYRCHCREAGGDERGRENRIGFGTRAPDHRFGLGTLAALGHPFIERPLYERCSISISTRNRPYSG
jgi:hypothetical protein